MYGDNFRKAVLHKPVYKITSDILWSLFTSKNRNNEMQISDSLPYWITTNSVVEFMGYMENSIYDLL
jgi:hypothetical protein